MQSSQSVRERVMDVLAREFAYEPVALTDTTTLRDDLHADSLDIVELVMELEKEFVIDITDEEGEKLQTIGDVIALVESKAVV